MNMDLSLGLVECVWRGCYCRFDTEQEMKAHQLESHNEIMKQSVGTCSFCDDDFDYISTVKSNPQHCSKDCWGQQMCTPESNYSPSYDWHQENLNCDYCNEIVSCPNVSVDKCEEHFCSNSCRKTYRKINNLNENDIPNWPNRVRRFDYGYNYTTELRNKIRDKYNRQCADCGIDESDIEWHLEIHHIKKAQKIDDPEIRNNPNNLLPFCKSCHEYWEELSPLRPRVV